ncbi:MAG: MDR family MFS transporter [Anaeromyxobacteraceae bacterium]
MAERPGSAAGRETSRRLTVVSLLMAVFLAAMEMTVVATAMPTVVGELGGLHLYAWAFAAYMLASTVTTPIWGKLADLRGRRPVLLAGLGLFVLSSLACGASATMGQLIGFRTVQGLAAGAVQPIALTIVGDLFDVRERARLQGVFGAVWGVAGIAGPLLGGAIVATLGWRWIFWFNVPVALGCAAMLLVAYHERPEHHPHRLDLAGAALLAVTVVSALLAARSPASGAVAIPVAVVGLALFLLVERRAAEPLLPLDLFARRGIAVASGVGALVGAAMLAMVTFVPLWAQSVLGATPTAAGASIAPLAIGWPIMSTISGRLLHRVGYRPLISGGLAIVAVAAVALLFALRPGVPLGVVSLITFLFGAGLGCANTPLLISVQTSVPWNRRGVATASTMFFRTIGGTLSVGLLGGVLAHALAGAGAGDVADKLLGPERALLPPDVVAGLSGTLQGALGVVFVAVAIVAAAAFLTSLLFPAMAVQRAGERAPEAEG